MARRTFRSPITSQRRREWMYGRGSHDKLTDSGDWREHIVLTEHRYMMEDMRFGCHSWCRSRKTGRRRNAAVAAPSLASASAISGEDFMQTGRTLAGLGLGGLERRGTANLLRRGPAVSDRALHRLSRRRPHGPRHRGGVRLCRPSSDGRRRQGPRSGGFRQDGERSDRRGERNAAHVGAVRIVFRGCGRSHHGARCSH